MDILLSKIKDNSITQLKNYVTRVVARNLSDLSQPCFYPELKKNLYEMLSICNLTEKDIKEFTKRRWKGRKEEKFAIHSEPLANFYVFLLQYFLLKKDTIGYQYLMMFYIIRQYANLMKKHFTYCNPEAFSYALEILTKTHLFAREKSISNALYFMAGEMSKKWAVGLKANNLDSISLFMQESRHRISQSVKSFAETYYEIQKEGGGFRTTEDIIDDDDESKSFQDVQVERGAKLIDDIAKKITIYKYIDTKALEESVSISKINPSVSTLIVKQIVNVKYSDNIRLILKLFLKNVVTKKQLCGKEFYEYIHSLISIKRTKDKIYFKQQINLLLIELIKDTPYYKTYLKQTQQTQYIVNLFLSYYLTIVLRNNICF